MSEQTATATCVNHPNVETTLRCNRCEKPICTKCAVLTPTGYRCKECVRGQQKIFDTTNWYDYPLAFSVVVVLAYIGSRIIPSLGFFSIFLAPVAGVIIAEAARFVVRRRRSQRLSQVVVAATIIGCLPLLLLVGLSVLAAPGALLSLVWQGVYTFILVTTVTYRFAGIRL